MSVLPEIQKKAHKLLVGAGVVKEIPVPIEKVAAYLGYHCEIFTPDSETIDVAGIVDHLNKKILLNQHDPEKRHRFVVAYELGHLVLQSDQKDYADYWHVKISDPKEKELDLFAGCLLMPEENFRAQWKLLRHNYTKLSELFNVSILVVEARAEALALTS